jgi:UDP-3-O-[3-hydroxymyristoyl] glucosamine N-acyltransferase
MVLRDFSKIVNGTIIGDANTEIEGVAGIKEAKKGDITFIASRKYMQELRGSKASCVIVKEPFDGIDIPQLKVANPHYAFAKAIECFYPAKVWKSGVSDMAFIAEKVGMGRDVTVGPFAHIAAGVSIGDGTAVLTGAYIGEGARIGNGCIIYPNVTVREKVSIGDRVIIHSGAVIGSDGFAYVFENGSHYKIPQVGGVIIEDDVEIGSNVSIDRATLGNTVIGKGTKIDNLVQIAHNVRIGENSLIVAQVGIAGSSEIGSQVTLAGQVGVADHAKIDSGTVIAAQSGVFGHVLKGLYSGSPVIPHNSWLRAQTIFAKLPEVNKKIRELEARLKRLEKLEKEDANDDRK